MLSTTEITEDLRPFLPEDAFEPSNSLVSNISTYINILEKWNARTNLTAIRDPRQILTRHFGESLFAARHLLEHDSTSQVIDLGSGAGFPGLPMKLWAPDVRLTLIESQNKKATFLREVVRALGLKDVDVFYGRGEAYSGTGDVVTLRAVEKFEDALRIATGLMNRDGRLGILIGSGQQENARHILHGFKCQSVQLPSASREPIGRVLLIAEKQQPST